MEVCFFDGFPYEIMFADGKSFPIGHRLRDYIPKSPDSMVQFDDLESDINDNNGTYDSIRITKDMIKEHFEQSRKSLNGSTGGERVRGDENTFKQLLYVFYTHCSQNKRLYKHELFIAFFALYGFQIPRSKLTIQYPTETHNRFKQITNPAVDFLPLNKIESDMTNLISDLPTLKILRRYECEPINYNGKYDKELKRDFNYFITVAYELVKQGMYVNKCENCGKWFVATSKSDEKYCDRISPQYRQKTCREAMIYIKQRKREEGNEAFLLYKSRYNVLYRKHGGKDGGAISDEINEFRILADGWKEDVRNGSKTEREYIEWLKSFKKRNAKKEAHDGNAKK